MVRVPSLILMCVSVLFGAFRTVVYIVWLKIREGLDNPFRNIKRPNEDRYAYVLGAGPSFNDFLKEYDEGNAVGLDVDYFASNFFVHDSHFTVIKPEYYCLSDGIFFCDSVYKDRGRAVMTALADNVTWPMILFVPRNYLKSDFLGILGNNGNIKVIGVHSISY